MLVIHMGDGQLASPSMLHCYGFICKDVLGMLFVTETVILKQLILLCFRYLYSIKTFLTLCTYIMSIYFHKISIPLLHCNLFVTAKMYAELIEK